MQFIFAIKFSSSKKNSFPVLDTIHSFFYLNLIFQKKSLQVYALVLWLFLALGFLWACKEICTEIILSKLYYKLICTQVWKRQMIQTWSGHALTILCLSPASVHLPEFCNLPGETRWSTFYWDSLIPQSRCPSPTPRKNIIKDWNANL